MDTFGLPKSIVCIRLLFKQEHSCSITDNNIGYIFIVHTG